MVSKVAVPWDVEFFILFLNLYGNPCSQQHPEVLLVSPTHEINTEIALWNRDVGVVLNYAASLLLMNVLLWSLKNSAAAISVLCVVAGQSEQDIHPP